MSRQGTLHAVPRRSTLKERRLAAIEEGFPSEADYNEADRLSGAMYAAVEGIEWRLRHLLPAEDEDGDDDDGYDDDGYDWFDRARPIPTIEDVGRLYSYLRGVDLDIYQLTTARDELRELLTELDSARLDAAVRTRADG